VVAAKTGVKCIPVTMERKLDIIRMVGSYPMYHPQKSLRTKHTENSINKLLIAQSFLSVSNCNDFSSILINLIINIYCEHFYLRFKLI
jgi:hypothetical protein